MRVIYLDVLAAVNLAMDFLLLTATARLSGTYCTRPRLAGGAALGAAYAVACCLPGFAFLSMLSIKALVGFIMVRMAFGARRVPELARLTLLFWLVSFGFAGGAFALGEMSNTAFFAGGGYYIDVPLHVVGLAAAICWTLTGLIFRGGAKTGNARPRTIRAQLTFGARRAEFTLLVDSGNELSDPVSGKPALVLDRRAAAQVLPIEAAVPLAGLDANNAASVLENLPGACRARFQLLPYRALGKENGLLLAFRPDEASISGKPWIGIAAISPERIANGQYEGLIGL